MISYQAVKKEKYLPLPEIVVPPKNPEDIESLEELYLTGLRIKQFHNARVSPEIYFKEALKRDYLDIRSNTLMGTVLKEDWRLEEAATHFRTALKRLTANYTRPRNCEPFYHLGVILQQQGKYEAAYDTLYRAAWDQSFASAAYFSLAQISCIRGNYGMALIEIDRSLDYNSGNLNSLNLKITVLRKMGNEDQGRAFISKVLDKDPLNFRAVYEGVMYGAYEVEDLVDLMRNNSNSYLDLAIEYLNIGFVEEAKNVLISAVNSDNITLNQFPSIHYYLGSIYRMEGNSDKALKQFRMAQSLPSDYCFPFRFESLDVYRDALDMNPSDTRAYYYLGNLLYDKQPELAIDYWIKATQFEPTLAMAYRNIGWGYKQTYRDLEKAIVSYEKAIEIDKTISIYFFESVRL